MNNSQAVFVSSYKYTLRGGGCSEDISDGETAESIYLNLKNFISRYNLASGTSVTLEITSVDDCHRLIDYFVALLKFKPSADKEASYRFILKINGGDADGDFKTNDFLFCMKKLFSSDNDFLELQCNFPKSGELFHNIIPLFYVNKSDYFELNRPFPFDIVEIAGKEFAKFIGPNSKIDLEIEKIENQDYYFLKAGNKGKHDRARFIVDKVQQEIKKSSDGMSGYICDVMLRVVLAYLKRLFLKEKYNGFEWNGEFAEFAELMQFGTRGKLSVLFYCIFCETVFNQGGKIFDKSERIHAVATAYAESVYQLAENACLHSDKHAAFFYIRLHDTENKTTDRQNLEAIKNRLSIIRRLGLNSRKIDLSLSRWLEICVADASEEGIIDHFVKNNDIETEKRLTLGQMFGEDADGASQKLFCSPETVTHHYGLRLFKKLTTVNGGMFTVASGTESFGAGKGIENNAESCEIKYLGTRYCILIPLSLANFIQQSAENKVTKNTPNKSESPYDISYLAQQFYVSRAKFVDVIPKKWKVNITSSQEKINNVEELSSAIIEKFQDIPNTEQKKIYVFDCADTTLGEAELLAKSVFTLICEKSDKESAAFLLAVILPTKAAVGEFVRFFSVFYDKKGLSQYMKNVQVALCTPSFLCGGDKIPAVNLIIAGENINSALGTAKKYAYYNASLSMDLLPELIYFTGSGTEEKSEVPLFPFDLYLSDCGSFAECGKQDTWFVRQIKKVLETNMQSKDFGCKIENAHVRTNSKVHILNFYEAELLFNNIGCVDRLAYILSSFLLKDITDEKKNGTGLIIGYENYSEILLIKTTAILNELGLNCKAIIFKNDNGYNELRMKEFLGKKWSSFAFVKVILPISATALTVRKIRNNFFLTLTDGMTSSEKSDFAPHFYEIWSGKHYVVFLVRDCLGGSETEKLYWGNEDASADTVLNGKVTVAGYGAASENEKDKYIIGFICVLTGGWRDAESCELCYPDDFTAEKLLVGVDKTSTIPNAIFEYGASDRNGTACLIAGEPLSNDVGNARSEIQKKFQTNDARINALEGCLTYAHTVRNGNHHLYYFDMHKYFEVQKADVIKWLCNLKENKDSFNIIVSPLHETNSEFLEAVETYAFDHDIRFLHLPLHDSYREDVRAKFSHISKEYLRIKNMFGERAVKIFYVDDVINSGKSLIRARNLIRMLLTESEVYANDTHLFSGIYTLLNRSSYDTLRNYVKEPYTEFHSFIYAAVPSVKTGGGRCPCCLLKDEYETLKKQAVDGKLRGEYMRLTEKYKSVDINDYDKRNEEIIDANPTFVGWMKQWVYYNCTNKEKSKIDGILSSAKVKDKISFAELKSSVGETNYRFLKDKMKTVIDKRDFSRFLCSHRAFLAFEDMFTYSSVSKEWKPDNPPRANIEKEAVKRLNELIGRNFTNKDDYADSETLISFLKVLSRPFLSRYHHIAQATLTYLLYLLFAALKDMNKDDNDLNLVYSENNEISIQFSVPDKFKSSVNIPDYIQKSPSFRRAAALISDKDVNADIRCRLLFTVLKRLASLGSTSLLCKEVIERCFFAANFLREDYLKKAEADEMYKRFIPYPDENDIISEYKKIIKRTLLIGSEESRIIKTEESATNIAESSKQTGLKRLAEEILIENTKLIYSAASEYAAESDFEEIQNNNISRCNPLRQVSIQLGGKNLNLPSLLKSLQNYFRYVEEAEIHSEKNGLRGRYQSIAESMLEITSAAECFFVLYDGGENNCEIFTWEQNENYRDIPDNYSACFDGDVLSRAVPEIVDFAAGNELRGKRTMYDGEIKYQLTLENCGQLNNIKRIKFFPETKRRNSDNFTNYELLVMELPLEASKKNYNRKAFVVLAYYLKKEQLSAESETEIPLLDVKTLISARNVLFLSSNLIKIFTRDAHYIANGSYFDVSLRDPNKINILHISDLHYKLPSGFCKDVFRKAAETLADRLLSNKDAKVDLMVVTGDVINASNTAQDIVAAYREAGKVLQGLARKLFGDEWKDRVLIIPGNHDYASMNESEIMNTDRSYAGSKMPAVTQRINAGIKFAYYLRFAENFYRKFAFGEKVDYDLNFIDGRFADWGLNFLCLNSSSGVSAHRQNKVALGRRYIMPLMEKIDKSCFTVCLVHHTPCFRINYTRDKNYIRVPVLFDTGRYFESDKLISQIRSAAGTTDEEFWSDIGKIIKDGRNAFEKISLVYKESASFIRKTQHADVLSSAAAATVAVSAENSFAFQTENSFVNCYDVLNDALQQYAYTFRDIGGKKARDEKIKEAEDTAKAFLNNTNVSQKNNEFVKAPEHFIFVARALLRDVARKMKDKYDNSQSVLNSGNNGTLEFKERCDRAFKACALLKDCLNGLWETVDFLDTLLSETELKAAVSADYVAGILDMEKEKQIYDKLKEQTSEKGLLILGGHRHEAGKYKPKAVKIRGTAEVNEPSAVAIYEAGKFLTQSGKDDYEIHYGIVCIEKKNKISAEYNFRRISAESDFQNIADDEESNTEPTVADMTIAM